MVTVKPAAEEAPNPAFNDELILATSDDVSDIVKIMQEASDFKMSRGDDLWGTEPFTEEEVVRMLSTGNLFIYKEKDVTAAAVLLAKNDERMWGDEQGGDETAVYVHKLSVSNAFRGQGIGQKIMSLAEKYAQEIGRPKMRLDCSYDNRPLCKYYEDLGFREVRRYDRPLSQGRRNPDKDVYRAALYEKDLSSSGSGLQSQ